MCSCAIFILIPFESTFSTAIFYIYIFVCIYLSIYLFLSIYLILGMFIYIFLVNRLRCENMKKNQIYLYIKCILSLWTYRYFLYLLVYYIICVSFWLFETWIQHATLHTDTCTQTDKLGAFVFVCILGSCFIIFSFSLSHFYFAFFSCEIFCFVFYFKIFAVISAKQTIKSN